MRLLVIEDDEDFATTLVAGLRKQGYAVDVAFDGEQGYELAQAHDYDLLILDLNLPGISGLEVCRRLRDERATLVVLMLTALGELHQRVDGLDSGADDYLAKPFAWEELLARVRALLRRDTNNRAVVLRCGELTLDTRAGAVALGPRRLKLTAKEYGLLQYLMQHHGKLVTNQELLEHVWDMEANEFSNAIRVHVTSLRRKLGDEAGRPQYIETVHGKGYRMLCSRPEQDA